MPSNTLMGTMEAVDHDVPAPPGQASIAAAATRCRSPSQEFQMQSAAVPQPSPILPRHVLDWVALLERLTPKARPGLFEHFRSLDLDDRRRRFGVPVDDDFIARYVDGLDFDRDVVFGARSGPDEWLGAGHLVLHGPTAELGLSVRADARGRGLGGAIFRFAVAHAARAGFDRLYMHCLTTNRAVMSIARSARMAIRSDGGESDAYLVVPPYEELARMLMREEAPAA